MKELLEALNTIEKYERISCKEMLVLFNEHSGQNIPDSIAEEWKYTGMTTVDMIMSDYLIQKGYKNLYQTEQKS